LDFKKKTMNTKIFLSLLLVSPLLLTSCKKELEPQDSTPIAKLAADSTPAPTTPTQAAQNPAAAAVAPSNASGGLNPAHGKPGHVCGIAVGAPLNSKATAAPQQTMQINNPKATTITAAPATKTAPGMNPPHGQPGHRCDISVGQPLNSAPTKTTTQTSQSEKPAMTVTPGTINADGTPSMNTSAPSGAPAILNAPTTTAPGMNPPHGQPGHVCGTAVGAPLPK
jgi:hypothetical protein